MEVLISLRYNLVIQSPEGIFGTILTAGCWSFLLAGEVSSLLWELIYSVPHDHIFFPCYNFFGQPITHRFVILKLFPDKGISKCTLEMLLNKVKLILILKDNLETLLVYCVRETQE